MDERTTIRAGLLLLAVAGLVLGVTMAANAHEAVANVTAVLGWLP